MALRSLFALAVSLVLAAPARAAEELQLWINPSVTANIDKRTSLKLETTQRFRPEPADDVYSARLWLGRKVAEGVTVSAGIERRFEGERRETRLLQQVAYPLAGPLTARTRIEQRFRDTDPRTGWRLRQRLGAEFPLSDRDNAWHFAVNAEASFVLRAGRPGAQTGLTGLRSFAGFEKTFGSLDLSLGYVRSQSVRNNAPDLVGHAPFIGLGFTL